MLLLEGESYKKFKLAGKEFRFTVDASRLPCGLNAAVYFVEIPDPPKLSNNVAAAPYGLGYGDAQSPSDIKFVSGPSGWYVNTNGSALASFEYDIL